MVLSVKKLFTTHKYSLLFKIIAALFFIFLSLEAILRFIFPHIVPPSEIYRQKAGGALKFKPNITFSVNEEEFSNTINTNSAGLNDEERGYVKKEGTKRIVLLGDSFIEAVQVPREKNIASLLENLLGNDFEVINMGFAGAGQAHEYLILKQEALKYSPDLVIVFFFIGNDVYNNSYHLESKKDKPFFAAKEGELIHLDGTINPADEKLTDNFLWKHSFAYRYFAGKYLAYKELKIVLGQRGSNEGVPIPYYVFKEDYSPQWEEAWDTTKALLSAIKKKIEDNNGELLLAAIPDKVQVYEEDFYKTLGGSKNWDMEKPNNILEDFCKRENISYIDLLPIFREYSEEGKRLYYHKDEHFNKEGHRVTAEVVYQKLMELYDEQ